MIVSGLKYRSLVRNNAFSASFDLSFSNTTGSARIGFSGNEKTYGFSFISGRILDHQNRYFSSYIPNDLFTLFTNFSGSAYDCSINNEVVTYSGLKDNFFVDNFFIDPSGVSIDASVLIRTKKPTLQLSSPSTFITGQNITGYLTTNSISGVKIFTGFFEDLSSFEFLSLPTGHITASASGQTIIKQKDPAVNKFITSFTLDTNAGIYENDFSITGVEKPFLDYVFNFNQTEENTTPSNDWIDSIITPSTETGVTKVAENEFIYSYVANYTSLEPSSLPISISLSYVSGQTGYYGLVYNVSVTSGGNGYLTTPTVIFSGGFDHQKVSVLDISNERLVRSDTVAFNLATGDPISFYAKSGIALPNPIKSNTIYYVKNTFPGDPELFTVSTGRGGAVLDITNTGGGYFFYYNPNALASGVAYLGTTTSNFDQVSSVELTFFGSGYTSAPAIIFSGGTGIINNTAPTLASGIADFLSYTKSFTGCYDLFTGINSDYRSFKSYNYTSPSGYSRSDNFSYFSSPINLKVSYNTTYDANPLVAKLTVSGIDNNLINQYITGVR